MKSSAEKAIFWTLYILISIFSFFGSLQNPAMMPIIFGGSLVIWYFILKGIFWVIRRLCRVFPVLLGHLTRIPKALWKFTLDRVREFGKALRDE